MLNQASSGDQVARVTRYKYFFTKCSQIVKYHHRTQEHHSKRLFYAKSRFCKWFWKWKSSLRQRVNTRDAKLILTRKCFTIAIKTIQLSSHITQHNEFIKGTFSSEIFFETNNIFAIRGKNSFLFQYVGEEKKLYQTQLHKFQDQTVSMKNLFFLNNEHKIDYKLSHFQLFFYMKTVQS